MSPPGKRRHKQPKVKKYPPSRKTPRAQTDLISTKKQARAEKGALVDIGQTRPSWRVSTLDLGGPWCWKAIDRQILWDHIHDKISHFETMTWAEIMSGGTHIVPVERLDKKAQKRLVEIEQDDVDELVSLRLSGKQRIWGIRRRQVLRILWWDPGHEVCPAQLRHT